MRRPGEVAVLHEVGIRPTLREADAVDAQVRRTGPGALRIDPDDDDCTAGAVRYLALEPEALKVGAQWHQARGQLGAGDGRAIRRRQAGIEGQVVG